MNEDFLEQVLSDGWQWLVNLYQAEGLEGTIITLVVGGLVFEGMGFIFWAAAAANARGMKTNGKKDS